MPRPTDSRHESVSPPIRRYSVSLQQAAAAIFGTSVVDGGKAHRDGESPPGQQQRGFPSGTQQS